MPHKPIICRRCKFRLPDRDELPIHRRGYEGRYVGNERVCSCHGLSIPVFTSRKQPPDLEFYDKHSK